LSKPFFTFAAFLSLSCAAGLVGLLPRFATERLLKLAASDVRP